MILFKQIVDPFVEDTMNQIPTPQIYRPHPTGRVVVSYRGEALVIDPEEQIQDSQTLNRLTALVCYLLVVGVFVAGATVLPSLDNLDAAVKAQLHEHTAHELDRMTYLLYPDSGIRPVLAPNTLVNWPFPGWLVKYDAAEHGLVNFDA